MLETGWVACMYVLTMFQIFLVEKLLKRCYESRFVFIH